MTLNLFVVLPAAIDPRSDSSSKWAIASALGSATALWRHVAVYRGDMLYSSGRSNLQIELGRLRDGLSLSHFSAELGSSSGQAD